VSLLASLALVILAAPAPAAADVAAFDAKVDVLEGLLAAARDGNAERFKALTGDEARVQIKYKDRPFAIETFAGFKDACTFDREATIAYDRYEGVHYFYQCEGMGYGLWVFNAWIKDGKVKYVSAVDVPPRSG
jgi:hypothetical protein